MGSSSFQIAHVAAEQLVCVELTQDHAARVVARQPFGPQLAIAVVEVLRQFLGDVFLGRGIQAGGGQAPADLVAPVRHVPAPRSG